ESMDYAGSYGRNGLDMMYTTYQHGVRISIDPAREDDEIIGPVVSFDARHDFNPYRPSDGQITFDWKRGNMIFDAPGVCVFAGLSADFSVRDIAFSNGVALSEIVIENDAGIPYPIADDERYFVFSLASEDGLALAQSKSITLALNGTSFNSGFEITPTGVKGGALPVLHARVGGVLTAPPLAGMKYEFLDWGKQPIESGVIPPDGALRIPANKPIWRVALTR
ncbi:MAG: hypothetical protein FWG05_04950, partial [Kiritimatiellaeota bacterium]|nr:hypothetical protein [Kiritimatiellota bacterium]